MSGRVAVEARRLQDRPLKGVGRAIARTLPALSELVDLVVLLDSRLPPVSTASPAEMIGAAWRAPGSVWLHWPVARWARRHLTAHDVFHGTFNAIPPGLPCPAVVTIYDLSFELHPEDFGAAKRRLFQLQARWAARRSARILTASRFSAVQLSDVYGVHPDRIAVVPLGLDDVFAPDRAAGAREVTQRLGVSAPYVVCVAGAPRRGAAVAADAWRLVRSHGLDVDLVVVGSAPGIAPAAGLTIAPGLDDEAWAALLAGAEALVYPTRYEGFGLPALEAAGSGTPVVCAPTGPLPEVLGDAAEWCESPTVDAIAAGLERVLTDTERAAWLRTAGLARAAASPSWTDVARGTADAYEAARRG